MEILLSPSYHATNSLRAWGGWEAEGSISPSYLRSTFRTEPPQHSPGPGPNAHQRAPTRHVSTLRHQPRRLSGSGRSTGVNSIGRPKATPCRFSPSQQQSAIGSTGSRVDRSTKKGAERPHGSKRPWRTTESAPGGKHMAVGRLRAASRCTTPPRGGRTTGTRVYQTNATKTHASSHVRTRRLKMRPGRAARACNQSLLTQTRKNAPWKKKKRHSRARHRVGVTSGSLKKMGRGARFLGEGF